MKPDIVRTVADLRRQVAAWRGDGSSVAMVPTMGALHAGHVALIGEAQRRCARVVVTLFVNPAQFAPTEDLASYPRREDTDRAALAEAGVDLLFAPATAEIYPADFATTITVGGPAEGLESDFRPHFFSGVATVVSKLLLAGMPDQAFFGEKDFQQLRVVQQLVRDLNIPVEIVGCPTIREADGLALSSRNVYLGASERRRAPTLHATLRQVSAELRAGAPGEDAVAAGRTALEQAGFAVDYLAVRNAETLRPVRDWAGETLRVLAAARLGAVRLIDNLAV